MRLHHLIFIPTLWIGQALALSLPAEPLKAYACDHCEALSHDALSQTWNLSQTTLGHDTQHAQSSQQYTITTTLQELQQGLPIKTKAPSAIIRIQAVKPDGQIKPQFFLRNEKNQKITLKEASSLFSEDNPDLDALLGNHTQAILQLKPELGFGEFILQSPGLKGHGSDAYLIQVIDKFAPPYITVETDKARYQYGDPMAVTITLSDDALGFPWDMVSANLVTPDGQRFPLTIQVINYNLYKAEIPLNLEKAFFGENGYIEALVESDTGEHTIRRQAHTAFSYIIPSAAVRTLNASGTANTLQFTASLEIATGSRYALQAILFARDGKGKKVPVETIQTAAWYAPGLHELVFSFSPQRAAQFHPPYEIGEIQLIDYGQLKPVFAYNGGMKLNPSGLE